MTTTKNEAEELHERMRRLQRQGRERLAAGESAVPRERVDAIRGYFRAGDERRNRAKR
jgi:hypothetical protein